MCPGRCPAGRGRRPRGLQPTRRGRSPSLVTNERRYRITKAELKKFEEALAQQAGEREVGNGVDPRFHLAMGGALESEVDELRRQLQEYEDLREGRVQSRTLRSLSDLPTALIQARIASRVTQKTLASRLGVAEQQVQRWEATDYSGVSISGKYPLTVRTG